MDHERVFKTKFPVFRQSGFSISGKRNIFNKNQQPVFRQISQRQV